MKGEPVSAARVEFGAKLKELRSRAGMTTGEVSERLGFSENLLRDVESGRRPVNSLDWVNRFADCYDVPSTEKAALQELWQPVWVEIKEANFSDSTYGNRPPWNWADDLLSSVDVAARPLVFLCHSSGDKGRVRQLYLRLKQDGIRCWFDEEDLLPGQDWDYEIRKAMRASGYVLACLSQASTTKAGYIQKELKFALDIADEQPEGSTFIIPARLEECEIPERLRRWQWVDLFIDSGYKRLVQGLKIASAPSGWPESNSDSADIRTTQQQIEEAEPGDRVKGGQTSSAAQNVAPHRLSERSLRSRSYRIRLTETEIVEEHIGTEDRLFENTSQVPSTRTYSLRREWTRLYEIDGGGRTKVSGLAWLAQLWTVPPPDLDSELKWAYAIKDPPSVEQAREEITVNVPPESKVQLTIYWKRIWQHGLAQLSEQGGEREVPYRVARGITFDHSIKPK